MALLQVYYLSEAIKRVVTFHMYLPNDVQDEFKDGNPHYQRGQRPYICFMDLREMQRTGYPEAIPWNCQENIILQS